MKDINIKNKRARYEYQIMDTFNAGIQLSGTEIKSIRLGKATITESFAHLKKMNSGLEECTLLNMNSEHTVIMNPSERKLLLNRQELNKLQKKLKDQGLTIIPLRLFVTQKGWAIRNCPC